ncbi:3'-N-debenzoyl-2'-deoxytaxol N-benzoyltransferase [Dichanthelium oligosanthes]|uniref:3'-N-debenzoyl-2'-deoxytaxol N-benzoyltransferase n=1 Tax=Dichanthelium oligosanthes TaxID=888268 RepID=A0A1E5V7T9_9POAL|nr:3'-N-debenzoyl-2'-deoxytaxol N-benzoyltransferase [Dichanthelium oligosanthes]
MEPQLLRVLDTVSLSPPAPPQHASLPLSGLDADRNMLDVDFRSVRFFPPPPPSVDAHAVLQRAFAAALGLFPALAGHIRDGHVVDAGTVAVPLVLAASELSVADVDTDAPASALIDRLAPGDGDGVDDGPALALQATRFACGGVALGMRVAHALCDGAGATKFLAAAARFARGQEPPDVAPVWERRELLGPRWPPRLATPVFDGVLALDDDVARCGPYGAAGEWHEQQRQLTRECFHVSDARVEALRARLADEAGLRLTTFEVVAAFIWRAKVKANWTSSGEVVKMVYSMNISKLVDPPLPYGYWGNVCVPVYVALAAGDLIAQPLAKTAALIKKSKLAVDDEYVRSYIDFQERHRGEGVTAGAVSAFTDWRRLGHGEVDFGWGGPDAVLPLSWRILGSTEPCFLLPYGAVDERRRRGFKVFVALQRTAVAGFTEEMQELLLQQQQSSVGKL